MSKTEDWTDDELLDEARDIESGLSDWEVEFVDSLLRQRVRTGMTERQRAKLRELLDGREGE